MSQALDGFLRHATRTSGSPGAEVQPVEAAVGVAARFVEFPFKAPKPEGWVRFVCFSDTHGKHSAIIDEHKPPADVLLHAGDFTNSGEPCQVESFAKWLGEYPAAHKVVIAGNHDVTFHPEYYATHHGRFHRKGAFDPQETRQLLIGSGTCTYLEDSETEVLGYRIYGSPWQPAFCDWAFNLPLGEPLRKVWERIPEEVDILITHGPPQGIGDKCSHGAHVGCPDLLQAIRDRRCAISLAGHIHEAHGVEMDEALGIAYINASTCTLSYRPQQLPIVFDLPPAEELHARRAGGRVAEPPQEPQGDA
mmetsp:Transcript_113186/g.327010  ORF Transcript_113186/g.327010 Transcript_113186/m.327010 type:complete len:306 (+) Transcript_113186:99-1016(+)